MKKFLTGILIMLLCASVTMAQTPATGKQKAKAEKTSATVAGPTKKDGTPDKRFKANKATPDGPKKKDGTLDMRYKANKDAAKKKS